LALGRYLLMAALAVLPAACASGPPGPVVPQKDPTAVQIFQSDITNRKYHSLGDLNVTVSKSNILADDPTPAQVDKELQKQAAKLGADAVILVRYGTVGMGVFTWGKLDGNGRAIAFDN
jgi:hypothetical protein